MLDLVATLLAMTHRFRTTLLFLLLAPAPLPAQDGTQILDTVAVAERFLYGTEATVGIAFDASFLSAEARAEALDLRQALGTFEGRPLVLGDVLLDLDLDGLGFHAAWRVIGPGTIVEAYRTQLRQRANANAGIHSMGTRRFAVVCACD